MYFSFRAFAREWPNREAEVFRNWVVGLALVVAFVSALLALVVILQDAGEGYKPDASDDVVGNGGLIDADERDLQPEEQKDEDPIDEPADAPGDRNG